MEKTRQDNNVNDHTSLLYAKYESKLSWPIRQGTMYDEDKKKDNDVTDCRGVIFVEYDIESRLIR